MPLASRIGLDSAGGLLQPAGQQTFCLIGGLPWATAGVTIVSHGSGAHASAQVAVGSATVRIGGLPAVVAGVVATCSHVTTGSGHVQAAL